jgi:hypothetical protein
MVSDKKHTDSRLGKNQSKETAQDMSCLPLNFIKFTTLQPHFLANVSKELREWF